jgi:multidrug efflux pump subunit AcrA (membrane-fusion protein)
VDDRGVRGKTTPVDLQTLDTDILGMFTGLAQTLLLGAEEVPLDLEGAVKTDGSPVDTVQPGDVFVRVRFGEGDTAVSRLLYIGHTDLSSSISIPGFQIPDFSSYFAAPEAEDELFPLEGSPLLSVTPRETMSVLLSVDELDILRYRKGMTAEIVLDALPGQSFEGTVTKISGVGTNSGGSSKFTVTVECPAHADMLPGMNASVVIRTGVSGPVLTLPVAAIQDRGSQSFVYTGCDARTGALRDPVPVVTGVSDGEWVEILSGPDEQQTVWYMTYDPVS